MEHHVSPADLAAATPSSVASTANSVTSRKRPHPGAEGPDVGFGPASVSASGPSVGPGPVERPKKTKVKRACDYCKHKKLKCSGTIPCAGCTERGLHCEYAAAYRRGRPPTPIPAEPVGTDNVENGPMNDTSTYTSRNSPELDSSEIVDGQYLDQTSNLGFLHRAWKRLSCRNPQSSGRATDLPLVENPNEQHQRLSSAGDAPFANAAHAVLPHRADLFEMLHFYFENCVVTYRCLHQASVEQWASILISNVEYARPWHYEIGHARASVIITILAIVSLRRAKVQSDGSADVSHSCVLGDGFFSLSTSLTEVETGLPTLPSAQARILQVLYLLQTARMNQAWYVFGSLLPIVSALGLHRHSSFKQRTTTSAASMRDNYIISQCRKRTFWVCYTIDKYLAVVFGRPRLYHDDDIDQGFPDCVNDEDMTAEGKADGEPSIDCHIDSLIAHSKLAQLIDRISRDVYSVRKIPKRERLAAAHRLGRELHEWNRALPSHLGTVRLRSLIPPFRKQASALKLAYCHAIIHANRPFLLGATSLTTAQRHRSLSALQDSISECLMAAKVALDLVDSMSKDGTLFHAFWWTPYATFCALAVVYVWEIQQQQHQQRQQQQQQGEQQGQQHPQFRAEADGMHGLLDLAQRCQGHLSRSGASSASPSHRYNVILEELRKEAKVQGMRVEVNRAAPRSAEAQPMVLQQPSLDLGMFSPVPPIPGASLAELAAMQESPEFEGNGVFDGWQTTDWMDLDASAFVVDFTSDPAFPILDNGFLNSS
ncbi:fungal-specific transcription factor domain-domain-containing protein [Microdochium bolleyi]|uniref:Fungal-specific transcription factor domain-domain-containing protein n=1 Tax=Microdochium bolleyi TaxID=196109 RepID=A0A136JCL7_9PEZI|nr:fungal-specific transcription factor domain-domain-containing protein [Microdochium bolleyi]